MTDERIAPPLSWKRKYEVAVLEPDPAKVSLLLEDVINAVLDQIDEAIAQPELDELNGALDKLRLRRQDIGLPKRAAVESSDQPRAA